MCAKGRVVMIHRPKSWYLVAEYPQISGKYNSFCFCLLFIFLTVHYKNKPKILKLLRGLLLHNVNNCCRNEAKPLVQESEQPLLHYSSNTTEITIKILKNKTIYVSWAAELSSSSRLCCSFRGLKRQAGIDKRVLMAVFSPQAIRITKHRSSKINTSLCR